jgi:hypothetical protein
VRQELQAVDEDARHRHVAQRLGLRDQREVAVVQVAHGRDEGGALESRQVVAQFGDGVCDVHGLVPYQAWS